MNLAFIAGAPKAQNLMRGNRIKIASVSPERKYLKEGQVYPVSFIERCQVNSGCHKNCTTGGHAVFIKYYDRLSKRDKDGATCGCILQDIYGRRIR